MSAPTMEFRAPADADIPTGHPDDPDAPTPGTRTGDPAAPYGYRADGTPRSKPGRRPGTPNREPRRPAAPRVTVQAAKPRGQQQKKKQQRSEPDYRTGVLGLLQLGAMPLLAAGARSDAALADAAAITMHAEPIADALHTLALERPEVAAVLDRVLSVGPYGVLVAAVMPLAFQVAANHRVLPAAVAEGMGAQDPAVLVAQMKGQPAPAPAA